MTRVLTPAKQAEVAVDRERDRVAWNLPRQPAEAVAGASLGSPAAAEREVVDETHSQFTPGGNDQSYAEGRRSRLRRGRLVGFSVLIPLWALSVVPLARESMDGREGSGAVLVYLTVVAISLGIAAAIRGVYVLLTKRRFWSPWVFLIAAVLAIAGYAVQSAGEEVVPIAGGSAWESRADADVASGG